MHGALHLATEDGAIGNVAIATGETAERDAETGCFGGWYWQDRNEVEQRSARLYLPNYFHTFAARLRQSRLYAGLMGNLSAVLRQLGLAKEASRHLEEAEDFREPT